MQTTESMSPTELAEFRDTVRQWLTRHSPIATVRDTMDGPDGWDRALHTALATELGVLGVAVPEEYGGAGAGLPELASVQEELGAALTCSPVFGSIVLAAQTLLAVDDRSACADLLPGLVDGSVTATVALNGELGPWDPAAVTLTAQDEAGRVQVSGVLEKVVDGDRADVLLVAARRGDEILLVRVAGDADGVRRDALTTLDRTRGVARVVLDAAPGDIVGDPAGTASALARASDLAVVGLAAEQIGAAQRCLDLAVDYARDRIQFGRAIGSFQAVKHRCADMLVEVETARSAVVHATLCTESDELAVAAAVCGMVCSDTFADVAYNAMRVFGGIGFTWEHDAHLYLRRATADRLMWGTPDHHAERLAQLVGDTTGSM